MPAHELITAEVRSRIIDLALSGMARNAIAREVGVGAGTVSRVAKERGLSFDRATTTAKATAAKAADSATLRAELAADLLRDVADLRRRLRAKAEPTSVREFEQQARSVDYLARAVASLSRVPEVEVDESGDARAVMASFKEALLQWAPNDNYGREGIPGAPLTPGEVT